MATSFSNQLPRMVPLTDEKRLIDYRWARILDNLITSAAPTGIGYVVDGSAESYATMTLYQGAYASRPASPSAGSIYYSLDTGQIFFEQSGGWAELDQALTGDVTKPSGSDVVTLNTVNFAPGTWGSVSQYPVITVNEKGLVTNVTLESSAAAVTPPGGAAFTVQFNNGGTFGGSSGFTFNPTTLLTQLRDLLVTGEIMFSDPSVTLNNLSPLTSKGDLLTKNGLLPNNHIRVPVGTDGQVLTADSTATGGFAWRNSGVTEILFNYGDATPKNLFTVAANKIILSVSIVLGTAFDDIAATLSIGDAGNVQRLLATTDILPNEIGTYTTEPGNKYGVATAITLSITAGTSTQGSGLVVITYQQ